MRSVRIFGLLALILLGMGQLAPGAAAAAPTSPIHIVKDCSTFLGTTPSFCVVSSSSFSLIPVGTKVSYLGPVLQDTLFLSSNVLLEAGADSTAVGYCINKGLPGGDPRAPTGICTFWDGTGQLAGFHAVMDVSIDESQLFHWDGIYYLPAPPIINTGRLPRHHAF